MNYSDFSRIAFPCTALLAIGCIGWALHAHPTTSREHQVTPPVLAPVHTEAHLDRQPPAERPTSFPPPGAVLTATPGPGPESLPTPPAASPGKTWLSEFDRALDREFGRIEAREKTSRDTTELAVIARLKEKLLALDELWLRADQATAGEDKIRLQQEAQQLMGEIIQLGRADRNQRLTRIARENGLTDGAAIQRFIEDVDRAMVETHLDWAPLFNRGAETPAEEANR